LPELFVLFLPFGMMSFYQAAFIWALINTALAITSALLTARVFSLTSFQFSVCTLAFLASTPLRVTLANGQHGVLILFCFLLCIWCSGYLWPGLSLGLTYSKYSFAPIMVLNWALQRRYKSLLVSTIPPLLGLVAVHFLVDSSLKDVLLGPLRVAQVAFAGTSGYADLMTVVQVILQRLGASQMLWSNASQGVALIAAVAAAVWIDRCQIGEAARVAAVMVFTLLIFKHVIYDFVVLLLPFALVLRAGRSLYQEMAVAIIVYFWFGCAVINRFVHWPNLIPLTVNFTALMVLAFIVLMKLQTEASS
jgi:hypothetical protein